MRQTNEKTSRIFKTLMALIIAVGTCAGFAQVAPSVANAEPMTGAITVTDVSDGDTFTATRVVNAEIVGNVMKMAFAEDFSYGDNADVRTDKGYAAYSALTDNSAISSAAAAFARQITGNSEQYHATARGGFAEFNNLPLGQYLVQGENTENKVYQNMIGTVIPAYDGNGGFAFEGPIVISAKYDVLDGAVSFVDIKKTVTPDRISTTKTVDYKLAVTTEGDAPITGMIIRDNLSDEAIEAGLRINQDVVVARVGGDVIDNALVSYELSDGEAIGFIVSLPDAIAPGTKLNVTFTGDAGMVTGKVEMPNVASVSGDNVEGASSDAILYHDDDYVEQPAPPAEEPKNPVENVIAAFGDNPGLFGAIGIGAIALIVIIIVAAKRRKKDYK